MDASRAAGFWIRVAAAVIDIVVCMLVERSFIVVARVMRGSWALDAFAAQVMVALFTLLFAVLYASVLHAAGGQTIGKLLVGVRVVSLSGDLPLFGQSLLRTLAYGISAIPLGLGFWMAGLRHDRRGLHDLLAGTRVERTATRAPEASSPPVEPPASEPPPAPLTPQIGTPAG